MKLKVDIIKELPRFAVNISFECGNGELLALVGPSGSGKTTLMRIIAGLDRADAGRITFNGDTWLDTARQISLPPQGRSLGYVFQEYALFPHLTVLNNVAFATGDRVKVAELLKLLEVWHLKDRKPGKLSGGERQRVALAQALARNPQVLLLDEPFSALDAISRQKLRRELQKIKQEFNLPIIHITHDLEEAEYLADAMLAMVDGRIEPNWLAARVVPGGGPESPPDRPEEKSIDFRTRLNLKKTSDGKHERPN
jgi:molybdate transport system ATP-binding protein